ncbi:fucose 4-O-acetylase-like acetyltransferase [Propionicimonas paludicola]|uniref:Fucose 4-O-acetylase-like acetyltransferase n=1 Tax=Propionicimonas paludicola TaxID=185243 RepID=A0A2A9CXB1_9ACTN|nr:acyltransferase [Propionicimonas paludicola]PFG18270.1 fucose 4-O-acetylase-like acetyltransferase [Propionicimonas paludicola]
MATWAPAEGDYAAEVADGRRDPSMDSLRFIAVVLVVLFHFMASITTRGGVLDSAFYATWALRVPLLIFVSGWFSSAEPPTRRSMIRLLQSIVVVYLFFELLQRVQIYLINGDLRLDWDMPIFGMWFLLTIGTLRVILPYLVLVRWFGLIAIVASLLVGFAGGVQSFSIQHSVALMPIFLLGWYARQSGLRERLQTPLVRLLAVAVLLASFAAGWALVGTLNQRMIGMHSSYRGHVLFELGMRVVLLAWAALVVLAMLALIPRGAIPLVSICGAGSMFAYLLHQPIQRQWRSWGGPQAVDGYLGVALLAAAAVTLAIVLMLPAVRRPLRWLVQPRWLWFIRKDVVPPSMAQPSPITSDRAGDR